PRPVDRYCAPTTARAHPHSGPPPCVPGGRRAVVFNGVEGVPPMDDLGRGASMRALEPPPSPEAGFSTRRRVRTGDVDPQRRLRLDSVARYLQDIAADNLDATGHARTDPFWIVRRTVIDVIEPI